MANLIYSAICSLDGFIEDTEGKFDWARPDEELHRFVNEIESSLGTFLYGRRMYETMLAWETDDLVAGGPDYIQDFARVWRAADKVVYSRTLEEPASARTTIERDFDPEAVRAMKSTAERDLSVAGAELAAETMRSGLVDEIHLSMHPISVGAGKRALPDDLRLELELLDEHRFASGVVHLHYAFRG